MNERSLSILITIIKEHIDTGAPVGSSVLVDKYKIGISPATVRNEMSQLESDGYIAQPHISAGRIPTENAYNLYLNDIRSKKLSSSAKSSIDDVLIDDSDQSFKETAKVISNISGGAIFWAFHKHNLFYTGISNLFQQPEFSQLDVIQDLSVVIDQMEEIIDNIYSDIEDGVSVLVGKKNPFGAFCSTVFLKYRTENGVGVCGILGPMRMDYEKNIAVAEFIKKKIETRDKN
jgi:heat-inducible transcriptional repressor